MAKRKPTKRSSRSRSNKKPAKSSTRRKVKKVIDGDTFELHYKLQGTNRVRIANIGAPEKNQRGGKAATNRLRKLIEDKKVTIKPNAKDKYGRIVADVIVNRRNIKKQLKK